MSRYAPTLQRSIVYPRKLKLHDEGFLDLR